MSTKERIEMIQANLDENERSYRDGKRSKAVYLRCRRDAKHRLTELRRGKP